MHSKKARKRWKRPRQERQDEPNADFLAALEAQRRKQDEEKNSTKETKQPKQIPGFYYDPKTNKYFPGKPPKEIQTEKPVEPAPAPMTRTNWARHLARRQISTRMQSQMDWMRLYQEDPVLEAYSFPYSQTAQHVTCNGSGEIALTCTCDPSKIFFDMAEDGGDLYIVEKCNASKSLHVRTQVPWKDSKPHPVSSMQWQPNTPNPMLSASALGFEHTLGTLQLFHGVNFTCSFEIHTSDIFTHAWNPFRPSQIAYGAKSKGSRVHVVDVQQQKTVHGPKTSSDVFAQAFCHQGQCILNGTRSGELWLWDLRSPQVAHSTRQLSSSGPAQIVSVHAHSNNASLLCATSVGGLFQYDLRFCQVNPVVEYSKALACGHNNRGSMKMAVDATESIVAAPVSPSCVALWQINNGIKLNAVENIPVGIDSLQWKGPAMLIGTRAALINARYKY